MRYITLIAVMMLSTAALAHERTQEEKKAMYEAIQLQLNEGLINQQQAQAMWLKFISCCQERNEP